jgi:CRISPR/Cas system Type II protein with McrA/HNH and RuvC-like nuclease domain
MLRYSAGQGKTETELKSVREVISTAMSWPESTREVKLARAQALSLLSREPLTCVWSGRQLTAESLHIDHCLPFALWPCDDLWNLLPTHQRENGRKSDRVPSADLLRRQRDQILGWWDKAYCTGSHTSLHEQFTTEARATLPGIGRSICGNDDIFSGLILQQMRLRHDQQAPLWDGPR